MATNVAQLMVTVGANTAMAEQGIMGLARMLGPTGLLGLGAVGAGLAVAGIGAAAIHMAATFQTGMTSIATGAGEAASALPQLSTGVLQLARDTGTSTQQLVEGLYMIESGGYRLNTPIKALDILRAAAEGAKVGAADLGVVADATDTVLKNFGETGLTATQAVNTLIVTVANGKTHMQDLADALSHILPTAAAAHVGLSDVMGAMATMTGEGVDAANAATYLRQMMIALMAPSTASEQALAKVGLTTAQVANEMHTSLPGAVAMITEAIGKKFPEGSAGYMQAVRDISGGSRQMQGMLLLSGQHMKTFNADVTKIGAAASGSSTQIAGWNLVQATFNQSMSKLGEIFQTVMITLGTQLLPVATQFMNLLATDLGPVVDALTGKNKALSTGMGGELLNAAKSLGAFFTQTVVPIIKTFANVLEKNVLPAIEPVVKMIIEKWLPPMMRIYRDVLPVLNPLLQAMGWIFQNIIGPALGQVAGLIGFMIGKTADLADAISAFIQKPAVQQFLNLIGHALQSGPMKAVGALVGSLPHFAAGGTMDTSGLALVGEAGPELVTLPGGAQVTPLGQLAGSAGLAPGGGYGSGGGMTVVNLQLQAQLTADGRKIAQVVVPHIHTIVRNATGQRGM